MHPPPQRSGDGSVCILGGVTLEGDPPLLKNNRRNGNTQEGTLNKGPPPSKSAIILATMVCLNDPPQTYVCKKGRSQNMCGKVHSKANMSI